jgi:hypothetical protein
MAISTMAWPGSSSWRPGRTGAASTSGTGGVRYATYAQLSLEERMLAHATGAPRMTRADAARALGADLAQLEAALAGRPPCSSWHLPGRTGQTRAGLQ